MFVQLADFPKYAVDELGNVMSLATGYVMKPIIFSNGYCHVNLYLGFKDGKKITKAPLIHRLVMQAFNGTSDLQVNHKDGDKTNNSLNNLEYCTPAENARHAWDSGLMEGVREDKSIMCKARTGIKAPNRKLSYPQAEELMGLKGKMSGKAAGSQFGISDAQVYRIWNGKSWPGLGGYNGQS